MRVQDVMSPSVRTIPPSAKAEDAWNLMRTHRIHHLVVTQGPRVVGLLSERDTGGRNGASIRRNRTVADLMTEPAVTVSPTTTVRKAANVMRGRSLGCLVVTAASGRPSGIVTITDLLELVGRGIDRGAATSMRAGLHHRVAHRKASRAATGTW